MASKICAEKGKKTLNVDHVIEALKQMNFDLHIKKLTSEADFSECQNEEKGKSVVIDDSQGVKDLINKKKKKKNKKWKHEFNEDDVNEQMELFEKSKQENLQNYLNSQSSFNNFESGIGVQSGNGLLLPNNKKMRLDQMESELFQNKVNNDEVDFD